MTLRGKTIKNPTGTRRRRITKKQSPEKSARFIQYQKDRRAAKSVIPYLRELRNPSMNTYKKARDMVVRLVLEAPPRGITTLDRLLFYECMNLSVQHLPGYATLDSNHIEQISSLIKTIERYIGDSSQQRPLNLLMLASPGAGKSHFIKCVASRLASHSVRAITFNMTSMESNDDLITPLDAARNLKVEDRLPLLFFDEFDSSPSNFALLLPLLWDGSLNVGQRDLRLGKVIIVMAGSDPSLPETMDNARSMRCEAPTGAGHNPKLIDLFSRINGGILSIPPFYDSTRQIDRRADKVCIAIQLLKNRFGKNLVLVPLSLLRFIATTQFRYDVRSIAHLIDLIPYRANAEKLSVEHLSLPLSSAPRLKESSLAYHLLHEDQALGIIKNWEESIKNKEFMPIKSDIYLNLSELVTEPHLDFYLRYRINEITMQLAQ